MMQVGSLVIAKARTGVCEPGERGVCYERYVLDGRPGWSVIFEGGRYDGFSPDEVNAMLAVTGDVCASVADYRFRNVLQLRRDFDAGLFAAAFDGTGGRMGPCVSNVEAVLDLTLAFERLVDGIAAFQQQQSGATGGAVSPLQRARVRAGLTQLLNELDVDVRAAAGARCAAYLARALPILPLTDREVVFALVADGLADYRRALRQVPLRGVGTFV